ncbi:MAG: ABC transporter substrate-binding protein [Deltaproteobacteria bacterium]|nr:ABC transporter substrate-binding protein [Deltaproteobacteria bacterium]
MRRALALALLPLAAAAADGPLLSPQEEAGRLIYTQGRSPSGAELRGLVGQEGTAVPAEAVTCAGCHGDDGLGRPEGAVEPSVITWSKLTTPYGVTHGAGRSHPPYDEKAVARAITAGVDPAGNTLDWTMPRYSMPAEDVRALVAYLKRLETRSDPGITQASVRLGTVLPDRGRLAPTGLALRAVLEGFLADVNGEGGINGRRLLLEVAGYDSDAGDGLAEARRLVEGGRVTALLSPYAPGAERALRELAEAARIPVVGPFTPLTPPRPGTHVFYVVAGIGEQARALAEHLARAPGGGRVALLHAREEPLEEAARAARAQLAARGGGEPLVRSFPGGRLEPALARRLAASGVKRLLFLGGDADLSTLLRACAGAGFAPQVLVPGVLVSGAIAGAPPDFRGGLLVAYPTGPADERPAAATRFARMQGPSRAEPRLRGAQVSAYASAAALAEALRRTGRNLSRERLLKSLEGLVEYDTGLAPRLTFGPGRRVGVQGAHLVAVDPRARTLSPVGFQRAD